MARVAGWLACAVVLLFSMAPAEALSPYGHGVLWRVERPGLPPSHLFGTVHYSDPRVTRLPHPVAQAFAEAKTTAFEIVLTPETQAAIGAAMFYQDQRTLDSVVGQKVAGRALDLFKSLGMPAIVAGKLRPFGAIALLAIPPEELGRQGRGAAPLDIQLQGEARRRGLPLYGLESLSEQLAALESQTGEDQATLLNAALSQYGDIEETSELLIRLYLERDIAGIVMWTRASLAPHEEAALDRMLVTVVDERNRRMALRMKPLLEQGGAFVAVGALHLPGEAGLLRLLERSGYRVTRIY